MKKIQPQHKTVRIVFTPHGEWSEVLSELTVFGHQPIFSIVVATSQGI